MIAMNKGIWEYAFAAPLGAESWESAISFLEDTSFFRVFDEEVPYVRAVFTKKGEIITLLNEAHGGVLYVQGVYGGQAHAIVQGLVSMLEEAGTTVLSKEVEVLHPPPRMRRCPHCSEVVPLKEDICPLCCYSLPRPARKRKMTAVLIAFFAGLFTWIYTWRKDKKKFLIGLILYVVGTTGDATFGTRGMLSPSFLVGTVITLYAFGLALYRDEEFYRSYGL